MSYMMQHPKTVKEASEILAEAYTTALITPKLSKNNTSEPWSTFPGIDRHSHLKSAERTWSDAGNDALAYLQGAGKGVADAYSSTGRGIANLFQSPINFIDIVKNIGSSIGGGIHGIHSWMKRDPALAKTTASGLLGASVGGLGGLAIGLLRKKKRPVGDAVTGALIGGLGGAGIGAASGYGTMLFQPGEGEQSDALRAGASAISDADNWNNGTIVSGRTGGPVANTDRLLTNAVTQPGKAGTKLVGELLNPENLTTTPDPSNKLLPSPLAAGAMGGVGYGLERGVTGLRNLKAGPLSDRSWSNLGKSFNPGGANASLIKPKSEAAKLLNMATRRGNSSIASADLAGLIPKALPQFKLMPTVQKAYNDLVTASSKGIRIGGQVPVAKLRQFLIDHGVGGIGAKELPGMLRSSLPKAMPTMRGALKWTLLPAALSHAAYSINNAGRLEDVAKAFRDQQPAAIQNDPQALQEAFKKMMKQYGSGEPDEGTLYRLKQLAGGG